MPRSNNIHTETQTDTDRQTERHTEISLAHSTLSQHRVQHAHLEAVAVPRREVHRRVGEAERVQHRQQLCRPVIVRMANPNTRWDPVLARLQHVRAVLEEEEDRAGMAVPGREVQGRAPVVVGRVHVGLHATAQYSSVQRPAAMVLIQGASKQLGSLERGASSSTISTTDPEKSTLHSRSSLVVSTCPEEAAECSGVIPRSLRASTSAL
eukprot:1062494-Rhodomonas_salina.1